MFEKAREHARAVPVASACAIAAGAAVGLFALAGETAGRTALAPAAAAQHKAAIMVNAPRLAARPAAPLLQPAVLRSAESLQAPVAGSLECLTAAVYYEARGETPAGQAAVAQVVLNRTRRPEFPKSVCGVVYQGASQHACQFSFACDGEARTRREPLAWRRARSVAARALGGYVMADVRRATHFHVSRLGGVWGGGMVKVAEVGEHSFYVRSARKPAMHPQPPPRSADAEAADSDVETPAASAATPAAEPVAETAPTS